MPGQNSRNLHDRLLFRLHIAVHDAPNGVIKWSRKWRDWSNKVCRRAKENSAHRCHREMATVRPSSVGERSLLEREWAVWQQPAPWPNTLNRSISWSATG